MKAENILKTLKLFVSFLVIMVLISPFSQTADLIVGCIATGVFFGGLIGIVGFYIYSLHNIKF